jgi:hypothetical protein
MLDRSRRLGVMARPRRKFPTMSRGKLLAAGNASRQFRSIRPSRPVGGRTIANGLGGRRSAIATLAYPYGEANVLSR